MTARGRDLLPAVVGLVFAGFLAQRGHLWGAFALVAVILGVAQAQRVSPRFARRFAGAVEIVSAGLGRLVGTVLLGGLYAVVFVPAAVVGRITRRPLGRPRGLARSGWIERSAFGPTASAKRIFGTELGRAPVRRSSPVLRVAGVVGSVIVVDLFVGSALTGLGMLRPEDRGDIRAEVTAAAATIMEAPAVAGEPWAAQHGEDVAEFQLSGGRYVPYVVTGYHEFQSPTVNTTDEERSSYRPDGGNEPLSVAFFGGSVMFGIGQRDEHTIPSAFARAAEDAGVEVEVHNYGYPGWVAWQELQLFERLLARGRQYDLAIFLDGFNEVHLQEASPSPDPTHNGVQVFGGLVEQFVDQRQSEPGVGDGLSDLGAAYGRQSAAVRLWERLTADSEEAGTVSSPPDPDAVVDNALDIYARARALARVLGDQHDVPVRFFWQPRRAGWPAALLDRLPSEVIDLSQVFAGLDPDDVYIDADVHTDEDGARRLAEAIWAELRPQLADP
jgi:hypothetical protein